MVLNTNSMIPNSFSIALNGFGVLALANQSTLRPTGLQSRGQCRSPRDRHDMRMHDMAYAMPGASWPVDSRPGEERCQSTFVVRQSKPATKG